MQKKGSKITVWMMAAVFCLFAFTACGNTADNSTETENPATRQETQDDDAVQEAQNVSLSVSSPQTDETVEGGVLHITGNAENAPNPGKDKVKMELSADGKNLGEAESLVSDLDQSFSAELSYKLTDTLDRAEDNTIRAVLRIYIDNGEEIPTAEKTVDLNLK